METDCCSDTVFENCGTGFQAIHNAVKVEREMPYVDHRHDAERAGFGDPQALGRKDVGGSVHHEPVEKPPVLESELTIISILAA